MTIHLGLDAQGMQKGAKQAEGIVGQLKAKFSSLNLGSILGGASLAGIGGWGLKLAGEAEQAKIAFEVMTGSADTAKTMLADLRTLAASTPLGFAGLQENAKMLLSFGVASGQILPTLRMLGDVSGGNADKMYRLSLAFGQINAAGRLMGQDLLQLINAGFNPLQIISEKTGRSMADLKKDMEEGKISFQMVKEAFQLATSEGGRFHQMMEKMAPGITAQFDKLRDNVEQAAMALGSVLAPAAEKVLQVGMQLTDWLKGLDAATIQQTLSTGAMVAAFAVAMTFVPKIITGILALVKAFKALTAAQILQKALSGPAGWAALAVSLGVAAATGYAVNQMFTEQEKEIAKAAESTKELVSTNDKLGESFKELTKEVPKIDKELEKLKSRAEQIAESVRTPAEVFKDTWSELNILQDRGLLSAENYARAVLKAKEELQDATKAAKDFRDAGDVSVGAAERFTMAGFSAVQEGRREMERQMELERQQVEEARISNELLTQIRDNGGQGGITLRRVSL